MMHPMKIRRGAAHAHLVLKIYGRIEVRDLSVDRFADNFSFAGMEEGTHF
jgi:hypothetical protein